MSDAGLSEQGGRERAARVRTVAPGGGRDRRLRIARFALPAAAAALLAALVIAPLAKDREVSFLLDKAKVETAPERLRVERARYSGVDARGRPFALEAGSGVQRSSADPTVELAGLAARMELPDGPASLRAPRGRFDQTRSTVAIDGPLRFDAANGYALQTRDVTVDLKAQTLASGGRVEGQMPLGTFSADRVTADLGDRHVVLDGRARLQIRQGAIK